MPNKDTDDAEKRKQKLELLRAKRQDQLAEDPPENGDTESAGKPGGKKSRFMRALAGRKQSSDDKDSGETGTTGNLRGFDEMSEIDSKGAPSKKAAMKKAAIKKMVMKKLAMKKAAMKKGAGGQDGAENKVDASSSLEEITKHRVFLEERIDQLEVAVQDRMAELKEVMELEAVKSKKG
jgi:hypothetical protein